MASLNIPFTAVADSNQHAVAHKNGQQHSQTAISLVEQCYSLKQLKQVHGHMLRTGLFFDPYSVSRLITAASLSGFSSLEYAQKVFDQIPQPNLYTWNTLIRAYASSPDPDQGLFTFLQMLHESPECPNKFTYPFVIKAASGSSALTIGKAVHGMVIKASLNSDLYILNSLVHLYGSCRELDCAHRVFMSIPEKDVVSWNSIITVFAQADCPEEALGLFKEMETKNVKPNEITMVGLLSACGKKLDLQLGRWLCSYIETNGISMGLTLSNVLLDMYMKCGSVEDAKDLFDKMPQKDIVSWTTMLDGHAKLGNYNEAQQIFNAIPEKTIAAWNALICAYEQNGKPKEALASFYELQASNSAEPDEITLVSVLSACAQLGAIDLGGWIHVYSKRYGFKHNCHVTTSLIDMYAKCGDLEKTFEVFCSAEKKDVFVWSAMIGGLAMHGRGRDAIDLFLKMQDEKVEPNSVTYTNLLCGCSHSGLVEEGRFYFDHMEEVHGVVPGTKHYTCMVDILGRAGLLEEAVEFIKRMPIAPSTSVWGALLGACKIHGNVEIAEWACSKLLELDPANDAAYVLLSNIYAKTGNWDGVPQLRKLMREYGLKKEPGCSSIEVDGTVHEFVVGDISHPLSSKIYQKLEEIADRLKSVGYVPNKSQVLQLVEEEDVKEQALNLHSEKLAIAFGLISVGPTKPIRVVKNLRVCDDCHAVAKLVSRLYDREILLRDRYRFHRFKDGNCSCADYW